MSPQRLSEMAGKVDNRQIFMALGGILALLIALLAYRAYRNTDPAIDETVAPTDGEAQVADPTTSLDSAPAGALVTAATIDPFGAAQPTEAAPTTGGQAFVVAGTGTEGLFLRSEASSGSQVLATLPEGTQVEALGEESNDGTRTWKRVRTPQGEGWVAADFLVAAP